MNWLLVDGSSLIFRAYYAVPATVRSPDGAPVNGVRGFLETLARLISERRPRYLAIATDEDWRPAWRVALIPEYKEHRTAEPIPPLLAPQMPVITNLLTAIGVDIAGLQDYEAEDVIASWAAKASGTVEIASGDRDLFALVEQDRVVVLYPEKRGLTVVGEAEVSRRYGIPGRRYADFAVLRGDPSDGLPGLRGVGAVAAASLIRTHGGVAGVLENARLSDAQRDYLARAMKVVPPVADLDIALPGGKRDAYPVDAANLESLTRRYGVGSSVERLVTALRALS
ncbi:MAG: 5'-3' exonuclease H3TH domain-containing protein [Candidatus Dormibacteria bacterium]